MALWLYSSEQYSVHRFSICCSSVRHFPEWSWTSWLITVGTKYQPNILPTHRSSQLSHPLAYPVPPCRIDYRKSSFFFFFFANHHCWLEQSPRGTCSNCSHPLTVPVLARKENPWTVPVLSPLIPFHFSNTSLQQQQNLQNNEGGHLTEEEEEQEEYN